MLFLDILAFWKSTADSFQHKLFATLWSFHQECRRNKSSSARLFVSGELLGRAWPRCYCRFSVDFPISGYMKTNYIRLNEITRTDNNRDERGVRSRNRDKFISLQYRYDTWRCESPVNKYLFVLCLPEGELTRWFTTFMCNIRDFLKLFFSVHPRTLHRNRLHPKWIEDEWISLLSRSILIRNFIQGSDLKDSLFAALTLVRGRFVPQRRQSVSSYWMCSSMLLAWSEIRNVDLYYKGPITNCPFT